jgi:anti-anti-sigma factor
MEILHNKKGNVVIMSLNGRFEPATSAKFEEKSTAIINEGERKILIDFSNLDYINSAGLRVILMVAKNLKKSGGNLALFGMKDHIKEIFDMTGFSSIITIVKTEEDGIKKID